MFFFPFGLQSSNKFLSYRILSIDATTHLQLDQYAVPKPYPDGYVSKIHPEDIESWENLSECCFVDKKFK